MHYNDSLGFLGTIVTSIIGIMHKAMPIILAIILIIFTGTLFGLAIYQDIKNKRWQDGYKL